MKTSRPRAMGFQQLKIVPPDAKSDGIGGIWYGKGDRGRPLPGDVFRPRQCAGSGEKRGRRL